MSLPADHVEAARPGFWSGPFACVMTLFDADLVRKRADWAFDVARRALHWSETARRWSRAKVKWGMSVEGVILGSPRRRQDHGVCPPRFVPLVGRAGLPAYPQLLRGRPSFRWRDDHDAQTHTCNCRYICAMHN